VHALLVTSTQLKDFDITSSKPKDDELQMAPEPEVAAERGSQNDEEDENVQQEREQAAKEAHSAVIPETAPLRRSARTTAKVPPARLTYKIQHQPSH
jgi:hypothetical protein